MANTKTIDEQVREIIVEQLGVEESEVASDSADIEHDLGADSLDKVELVMTFEEQFELTISDEDAEKIHTVGDAVKYVVSRKQ